MRRGSAHEALRPSRGGVRRAGSGDTDRASWGFGGPWNMLAADPGPVPRRTGPAWGTAQNRAPCRAVRGSPPGRAPRESGSPATHPIGQPGLINRAEVNVATCRLEAGSVRGKQNIGRRTPAGDRRPVAAGREVSPLGSPHLPCAQRVWPRGRNLRGARVSAGPGRGRPAGAPRGLKGCGA